MATFTPRQIELTRTQTNVFTQRPAITDSSNTIVAGQLVKIVSNALVQCAASDTVCYGWCVDASKLNTDRPPTILPFPVGEGEFHNVFDPTNGEFEITVGNATTTAFVTATAAAAVIGSGFGLGLGTSTYAGLHYLNTADTTNKMFVVVGWADGVVSSDVAPRVRVRFVNSFAQ
jgi:hypothetical protein